jgi:biopolymer transport protein ExbB
MSSFGGLFAWIHGGGIFMYAILIVSLVSLAVFIYKAMHLFLKCSIAEDEVTQSVVRNIESDNYARALQYCNVKDHPLTNIIKAGLSRANKSEKEIKRAMEVSASEEIPQIRKWINVLPHLSNLATLLGLLGTIQGLIIAFGGMESADAVARQKVLAQGIAVAFRTTFLGLSVAIPTIIFYLILTGKQNKLLAKIEYAAGVVVDAIVTKNKKSQARG